MGILPLEYDLPLWPKKPEGVDIVGLPIRRLVQACCNGSILHSQSYFLLLFLMDNSIRIEMYRTVYVSQVATSILRLNSNRFSGRLAVCRAIPFDDYLHVADLGQ